MNQEELKQRLIELLNETFAEQYDKRGLLTAPHTAEALIANGVTIRERGEWKFHRDGSGTCKRCGFTQRSVWDYDNHQNFCGVCGADMRDVTEKGGAERWLNY